MSQRFAPPMNYCTIVVPCYNEAARFRADQYEKFLHDRQNSNIALLFVNDGSRDETLSVLETMRSKFPTRVFVLDQQPNRGKAEAVRRGMLHVISSGQANITGFWDADLATPLDQIHDLLGQMIADARLNLVFGARVRLLGHAIHRQQLRHYLGRLFATAASLMLRLPVYDTQCGAKLFRITPDFAQVISQPFLSRWIFDVEMLARFLVLHDGNVARFEEEIYEYPLPVWTDVAGSKVRSMDFFKAVGELATIYRRTLHGRAFSRQPLGETVRAAGANPSTASAQTWPAPEMMREDGHARKRSA